MKNKFIEYDLPLAEISEESAREKNIRHGHPSTLHIWWARRPLASSRATAFAALIDDPGPDQPEKRAGFRKLIKELTPWEAVKDGNSEAILKARDMIWDQYGRAPKVLDPFAGGGSIPLEALRLGCETYASDYNPVAVFIEKATLEWPQKYGIEVELPRELVEEGNDTGQIEIDAERDTVRVNLLAFMVERWANRILDEAREEIGHFYPTESGEGLTGKRTITEEEGWTPVGYLWARTIPCQNPSCGAEIPLIRQFWLAKKGTKKIAYRPLVEEGSTKVSFEILSGSDLQNALDAGFDPGDGTVSRANASCVACGQVTKAARVRELSQQGSMGQRMVAVVLHHPDETGKKYRLAKNSDIDLVDEACQLLTRFERRTGMEEVVVPDEELARDRRRMTPRLYGLRRFGALFGKRSQLALCTFAENIRSSDAELRRESRHILRQSGLPWEKEDADDLARAVTSYMAVIVDRICDYISTLTTWVPQGEFIGHVFTRQALPMTWDYPELNPFSGSGGDWQSHREWVLRYIKNNSWPRCEEPSISSSSATDLPYPDDYFDAIITDPPYYDNISYAVLSDFFYVWLKQILSDHFPELFSTPLVPRSSEAIMEPGRHKDKNQAREFFEGMLQQSFREIHRTLRPGGTTVVVYAHKTTTGWETMLSALRDAGLVVTGSWPLHTERRVRLVQQFRSSVTYSHAAHLSGWGSALAHRAMRRARS